jgi:hypothetical protein
MKTAATGLQYLLAGLVGMVIACLPTSLLSYAVLPPDGPIGEGFVIMLIYLVCCCACVPGFFVLMRLHMQGRRDTRLLIACELILRASVVVAAGFFCFVTIKLPTRMEAKCIVCLVSLPVVVWAINPASWQPSIE